jgi:hypothetical protein
MHFWLNFASKRVFERIPSEFQLVAGTRTNLRIEDWKMTNLEPCSSPGGLLSTRSPWPCAIAGPSPLRCCLASSSRSVSIPPAGPRQPTRPPAHAPPPQLQLSPRAGSAARKSTLTPTKSKLLPCLAPLPAAPPCSPCHYPKVAAKAIHLIVNPCSVLHLKIKVIEHERPSCQAACLSPWSW